MRHLWEQGSYWCYCNHHTSTNFKGLSDMMSKVRARESVGAPTSSKNKERKPPPPSPNTTSCCCTLSEAKKFFSQHQALHEDAFSRSSSKCRQLMKWRIIRVRNIWDTIKGIQFSAFQMGINCFGPFSFEICLLVNLRELFSKWKPNTFSKSSLISKTTTVLKFKLAKGRN